MSDPRGWVWCPICGKRYSGAVIAQHYQVHGVMVGDPGPGGEPDE